MVVVEFSFFRGRASYFQGPPHKTGSVDQATLGGQLFWAERMTTSKASQRPVRAPESVWASDRGNLRSGRKR